MDSYNVIANQPVVIDNVRAFSLANDDKYGMTKIARGRWAVG